MIDFSQQLQTLRSLVREWRAGELRILAAALVIAVAAISSVNFFTDRVQRAMTLQAGELLGADLALRSSTEVSEEIKMVAARLDLLQAQFVSFPSIVLFDQTTQLAEIKAVTASYPLRGQLRVSDVLFGAERVIEGIPKPGEIWLEARLMQQLDIGRGDYLQVGEAALMVSRVLTYEPDRGGEFFQLAPRAMMHWEDLPATGLITPASRVRHSFLVAGDETDIERFRQEVKPLLASHERLEDAREASPPLRQAITRAEQFLGLAALVAVLLAGGAIAVAARHYSDRQSDTSAVMRCLGASRALVLRTFMARIFWLALVASLLGVLLGYLAQKILVILLTQWFTMMLPGISWWPVLTGLAIGLVTAQGFALPAILRLGQVPPLRVLRRELDAPPPAMWLVLGLAVITLGGLLLWQAADPYLALWVLLGAFFTVLLLWILAWGLVIVLRPIRARGGITVRFGIANLSRRGSLSAVQLSAFGLGIMALLLLGMVRVDLLSSWESNLSPEAPNHFMINVQPEQVQPLQALFVDYGIEAPAYHPMVRGRLTHINGKEVIPAQFEEPRAERLVAREFNLSFSHALQTDNRITAGRWWSDEPGHHGFSVEEGLAQTLNLALGDTLQFNIAGQSVEAPITSLRTVEWDSFNVNFFVIAPPHLLETHPATYITSFRLDADGGGTALLTESVRQFPSITILDIRAIMEQVRDIIDRASLAVEYVFLFTLAAGLTVLYAAIQATRSLRQHETAVLRTLGASRRQVLAGLLAEFTVMGALAGLLGAAGASAIGYVLALHIFDLPFYFNLHIWWIGMLGGALGVGFAGWLGARSVLLRPPLYTLRQSA